MTRDDISSAWLATSLQQANEEMAEKLDAVEKLVEAAWAVLDDQMAGRAAIRGDVSLRLRAALAAWEAKT
jgi:hypothetical protein